MISVMEILDGYDYEIKVNRYYFNHGYLKQESPI